MHTAHADVMAELAALSETTAGRAEELRALELERCDQMVAYGRWVLALAALFALWYAALWAHVVARARLLTWKEIAVPWRAR